MNAFEAAEAQRHPDVLFVSHDDCRKLLTIADTMRICEEVYLMHARGSISPPVPPAFKIDDSEFHNHWHVKGVLMKEIPITGVRFYNYYDDGSLNTVGRLECNRYVVLSDPRTGRALAFVDEHLSYGWRSAAAAVLPCKWIGPTAPKVLGLVGAGTLSASVLQCLAKLYRFEEIRVTSLSMAESERFAAHWQAELGMPVRAVAEKEVTVRGADIVVGATTSPEVMIYESWVKPGALAISLTQQQFELAGFARMDKAVVDSWELNIRNRFFRQMVDNGLFRREQLYAEVPELIAGTKQGREHASERIVIHTTGFVSQDIAICHWIYQQAKARGMGITLPAAR